MADKEKVKKDKSKKAENKKKGAKKAPKKLFTQQTFMGITVVGLLALVLLYMLIYIDYTDRTSTLESSNASLRTRINELQGYADNIALYQSDIEEMKTEIENILGEYPAGAREEDVIMLAVQMQVNKMLGYSAINMNDTEEVYNIPYSEVISAEIEGMDSELIFKNKSATYAVTTTYDDLKNIVADIFASSNRIGLEDIILSKNANDGTLSGNIELNFYSVTGTGKGYTPPNIAKYIAGTDDIFKSDVTNDSLDETEGEGNENGENAENGEEKSN